VTGDGYPDVVGEFADRSIRVFDVCERAKCGGSAEALVALLEVDPDFGPHGGVARRRRVPAQRMWRAAASAASAHAGRIVVGPIFTSFTFPSLSDKYLHPLTLWPMHCLSWRVSGQVISTGAAVPM
jgi:hypothetical protein